MDDEANVPHEAALRSIGKTYDIARSELKRAYKSETLSALGKREEGKKIIARAHEALEKQQGHVDRLEAKAAATRAKALEVPAKERTTADLLMEREIRDRLHAEGADSVTLAPRYYKALSNGDTAFARAVENAPAAFPLLTDAMREHGEEETLKRSPLAPQLAAEEAEHAIFRQITGTVRVHLRELEKKNQIY